MLIDPAQLDELFAAALAETAPGARTAFLDQACAGDPELRERLNALLAAHDAAGSFLQLPGSDEATAAYLPLSEGPGTTIGPYKILQQIGEGGMGVVFMAEQTEPIQRTVALKIIKPGMDTRQVIARFEAERQALALMDHPNIARVLDAGTTESGRPYFVMELVKGMPITKYCDDHHLAPRERLELFLPVCQAVQHAHQKGIIHRDLKPSNVMIALYDGRPIPKIIDFGVAKATGSKLTDRTMFTEFGAILGTLEYMSPEQAELNQLDVDTRADIYSLGVLLYELLTGTTPLERKRMKAAALHEVLRVIREEEPPKPSTRLSTTEGLPSIAANRGMEPTKLSGLVRGELDWIVMKALEKDRNRRYETANGFAADVQRYLNDEAVQACPPSSAYRFRKFARRNKRSVMAASVILLTLIAGILGTTIGLIRAEKARQAEMAQRQTAETREAETQAILNFFNNKVIAAAGPEGQDGGLGREVTLRKAIEASLPFVETSFTDQPLIEARLRSTLGQAFLNLGEAGKASEQFQKARTLRTKHLGTDHPDTLSSMSWLASSYWHLGRRTEALKLDEETLALCKVKFGPDHPNTLSSMSSLAATYYDVGRRAEALKLHQDTLALRKATLGPDHLDTLSSMCSVALSYNTLGRHAEALKLYEEALTLQKVKLGPDHPRTIRTMQNVAGCYRMLGRHAEALKLYEETLAKCKAKLGFDHPLTLWIMDNVANSYSSLGRHAEALKVYEETLALQKTKLGPDHPDTFRTMNDLAGCYSSLGRHAEALKLYEETLALQKTKLGPDHPETLLIMNNLADTYSKLGRHAEALKLEEETLALQKTKLGPDHPDTLLSMLNLIDFRLRHFQSAKDAAGCRATAEMYEKLERTDAQSLYNAARLRAVTAVVVEHDPKTLTGDAARLASVEADRAMAWLKQAVAAGYKDAEHMKQDTHLDALREREDFQKLVANLDVETIKRQKATLGADHPDTIGSILAMAVSLRAQNQYEAALPLCREGFDAAVKRFGYADPTTTEAALELGFTLRRLGKYEESLTVYDAVIPALKQSVESRRTSEDLPNLSRGAADAHAKLGQFDLARKRLDESLKATAATDWKNQIETAWILATGASENIRDGMQAREIAKRAAIATGYKNASVLDTLAAAYAETGDFDAAVQWEQKAIELAPDTERFQKRIDSYRSKKRWWVEK